MSAKYSPSPAKPVISMPKSLLQGLFCFQYVGVASPGTDRNANLSKTVSDTEKWKLSPKSGSAFTAPPGFL